MIILAIVAKVAKLATLSKPFGCVAEPLQVSGPQLRNTARKNGISVANGSKGGARRPTSGVPTRPLEAPRTRCPEAFQLYVTSVALAMQSGLFVLWLYFLWLSCQCRKTLSMHECWGCRALTSSSARVPSRYTCKVMGHGCTQKSG